MKDFRLYGGKWRTVFIGIGITFTIIITIIVYDNYYQPKDTALNEGKQLQDTSNVFEAKESVDENIVVVIEGILNALHSIYFASSAYTEIGDDSFQFDALSNLMDQNKLLIKGRDQAMQYGESRNEIIATVAKGISVGADMVIGANTEFIAVLRNYDPSVSESSELQYQAATYLSNQKEGYEIIYTSTPFLMYAVLSPAESENPTGPIPYKISKKERRRLLKRIDELFGDGLEELEKDRANGSDMNAVILGIENFRDTLKQETY